MRVKQLREEIMPKYNTRRVKTVGALIKELEKLPKSAKLESSIKPEYYNTGETAKKMGLKPMVGFDVDF